MAKTNKTLLGCFWVFVLANVVAFCFLAMLVRVANSDDEFVLKMPKLNLAQPVAKKPEPPKPTTRTITPPINPATGFARGVKARYNGSWYSPERGVSGAVYLGQALDPNHYPDCPMCVELRGKWRAASQPVTVSITDDDTEYETVTKTRKVTKYRKVCTGFGIFKKCRMVPYEATETYTERVPIKKAKAKPAESSGTFQPTPEPVVQWVFEKVVKLTPNDVVIDAGCGDGRFVEAAAKYGCRAVGVEIDPETVVIARKRVGRRALIMQGDATEFDYSGATVVVVYQMPELLRKIVARIPRGVRIVSYSHEIPGVKNRRYTMDMDGKPQSIYVAEK